jgi:putative salt-induced outer membrane protein
MKAKRRIEGSLCCAFAVLLAAGAAQGKGGEVAVARGLAREGAGLKGQVTVDVGVTTGNTELVQLKTGVSSAYEVGPHGLLGSVTGGYAEHDRTAVGKQLFFHANYRYRLFQNLALEAYANYAYDKFAGFDVQLATGPDVVFLFEIDAVRVDVGVGYMLQYEDYGEITGPAAGDHDLAHRAQLYVFLQYALAENLELIEHAFYMPRLDSPGPSDYMIISASSLSIQINPILSFQNSFNLALDNPAPLNTRSLNTELMAGLAVKF